MKGHVSDSPRSRKASKRKSCFFALAVTILLVASIYLPILSRDYSDFSSLTTSSKQGIVGDSLAAKSGPTAQELQLKLQRTEQDRLRIEQELDTLKASLATLTATTLDMQQQAATPENTSTKEATPSTTEEEPEFRFPLTCPTNQIKLESDTKVVVAYHVGMLNNWPTIVRDQLKTITHCGLISVAPEIILSYSNGNASDILSVLDEYGLSPQTVVESTAKPWEAPVMNSIHEHCAKKSNKNAIVFYLHNKGSSKYDIEADWKARVDEDNTYSRVLYWRKYMEYFTLERPQICIDKILESGAKACGVGFKTYPFVHYSGNFWASSCAYIRTLSPIDMEENRSVYTIAERWIGTGALTKDFEDYVSLHDTTESLYKHLIQPEEYSDYAYRWRPRGGNQSDASAH